VERKLGGAVSVVEISEKTGELDKKVNPSEVLVPVRKSGYKN
jgi:hypothetical protein